MKEDAPTPTKVPAKRRQLRDALDRWLAEWAASDDLTPSERRRVEEERERRKAERRRDDVTVGVLIGDEGVTPEQADYITGYAFTMGASAIVYTALPAKLRRRLDGISTAGVANFYGVVRNADVVLAAPRAADAAGTDVWQGIRYARHRKVPVRIVYPNGSEG